MEHTEDLRNVNEGDEVTITTTEGEEFDATCVERRTDHAAPETGEVRQSTAWFFDSGVYKSVATIIDGLASSQSELGDFPKHKSLWDEESQESIGYISSVQIHGPKLES